MTDERKSERFNMLFAPSELADIDAWAEQHGYKSRAEAIRTLIARGMDKWQPVNLNDIAVVAMRTLDDDKPLSRSQYRSLISLIGTLQSAVDISTTMLYDSLPNETPDD